LNTKCHAQAIIGKRIHQSGKDQEAWNVAFQEAKELKSEISQLGEKLLELATNFSPFLAIADICRTKRHTSPYTSRC